jgi:putative transposase
MTVAEAVRQIGVTQQTFYRWRKLYGGTNLSQLVDHSQGASPTKRQRKSHTEHDR